MLLLCLLFMTQTVSALDVVVRDANTIGRAVRVLDIVIKQCFVSSDTKIIIFETPSKASKPHPASCRTSRHLVSSAKLMALTTDRLNTNKTEFPSGFITYLPPGEIHLERQCASEGLLKGGASKGEFHEIIQSASEALLAGVAPTGEIHLKNKCASEGIVEGVRL